MISYKSGILPVELFEAVLTVIALVGVLRRMRLANLLGPDYAAIVA